MADMTNDDDWTTTGGTADNGITEGGLVCVSVASVAYPCDRTPAWVIGAAEYRHEWTSRCTNAVRRRRLAQTVQNTLRHTLHTNRERQAAILQAQRTSRTP